MPSPAAVVTTTVKVSGTLTAGRARWALTNPLILSTITVVPTFAHGDADHVRGTVTAISAQSIVVTVAGAATPRTLRIDAKTVFLRASKTMHIADVHVGDHVVVDVPKKTDLAEEINFSRPAAKK